MRVWLSTPRSRRPRALLMAAMEQEHGLPLPSGRPADALLKPALEGRDGDLLFDLALRFRRPVVGAGAPAATCCPEAGRRRNTELIVPSHAGVCDDVGVVVVGAVQRADALIAAPKEEGGLPLSPDDGCCGFRGSRRGCGIHAGPAWKARPARPLSGPAPRISACRSNTATKRCVPEAAATSSSKVASAPSRRAGPRSQRHGPLRLERPAERRSSFRRLDDAFYQITDGRPAAKRRR